ncbi:hypothetical protein BDN72DRAFT_450080 [Pluteus cervinus]|uniref:Uncharacterized protein n=1 Tax=Pluteus cervinus TaxID=181527 RepID=A0ACD3BCV7_9AGAR|nr:hypothetical protein BDN72DRAFT_450080 [Pluteus cervinus]
MSQDGAPRRSQREKKIVKPFVSAGPSTSQRKRKRTERDSSDDEPEVSEPEEAPSPVEDNDNDQDEEVEDYRSPKPKTTSATGRKGKSKAAPKPKGQPPVKKPRTTKATAPKAPKPAARRGRKPKEGEDAYDAAQVTRDTKIASDNPLFNAVMNPSAALQSTAEDFLESLQQSPGPAQADLINLILRSCGCNDSVDGDEVVDYDGVVDALDNFTEALKQHDSPIYPLTSKLPTFKKFRKSLSEFLERLVASAAELGSLYSTDLLTTLQAWVVAMSSSQIRSFRHTATVVALEVETALCDVAASIEKEAEIVGRQRESEKKRKVANKGTSARLKELEAKAKEIKERRTQLDGFLKEFVDGVFVHRYRDLDPNIRAECVRSIGLWFKKYPSHFLDASYLRYVGWVLSDSNTHVRLEAVKALIGVYDQSDYLGSLNHFTERFKPRLIEMATGDTELTVRVAVIQVLSALDSHSLLEDDEREKLCLLLFDGEAKVRKSVSKFVRGVWVEAVEERFSGHGKVSDEDRTRAGMKSLAILLVKWGKALDKMSGEPEDTGSDAEGNDEAQTPGSRRREVAALVETDQRGRTALAVEALWEEVEPVSDWESLLDVLLLDHSAAQEGNEGPSRGRTRPNGKNNTRGDSIDEAWRLDEVEESMLLEVLVAALRRARTEVVGSKKGEEETVNNDVTRALIKGLPRLFVKHQSDPSRIADVLWIPTLMNLDLYLEMRMIPAYASLWDDVIKQFLSHSSITVLTHAMAAMRHFMDATSLSNTNSPKILELEDELSSALRDAVAERDEIEVASFTEDEILSLTALCTRLAVLAGTRDLSAWMEEDEGGKQTSAWDIVIALAERGRLGYKEEEQMVEQALRVLMLHILWKSKASTAELEPSPEETRSQETLVAQRAALVEKLAEYAVGTTSNTAEGVKRAAFKHLLDIHVLFAPGQTQAADGTPAGAPITLTLDDETQYRCAGYIQAEIERSEEDEDGGKAGKKPKGRKRVKQVDLTSRAHLEQEYLFLDVISTFLRGIRAGAVHVKHGSVLLAHYGRLGPTFDACAKVIIDVLREEGMYNNEGDLVVSVVTNTLQEAFTLVLENVVPDEGSTIQLAKVLASCFIIRGSQLSVVRRLEAKYVVKVHTQLLDWIVKRLSGISAAKNKKALKVAIIFFKVLIPLVNALPNAEALTIKAHMDQALAQAKIEVSPTLKMWEPQRAYEKRLSTAMAKGAAPVTKGRKGKNAKSAANITDGEDTDGDALGEDGAAPSRPLRRSGRSKNTAGPAAGEGDGSDSDEPQGPTTPKARPRPRPRAAQKAEKSPTPSPPDAGMEASSPPPPTPSPPAESPGLSYFSDRNDEQAGDANGLTTPKASSTKKRARTPEDEEMEVVEGLSNKENDVDMAIASPPTPPNELQIRRKRIRH